MLAVQRLPGRLVARRQGVVLGLGRRQHHHRRHGARRAVERRWRRRRRCQCGGRGCGCICGGGGGGCAVARGQAVARSRIIRSDPAPRRGLGRAGWHSRNTGGMRGVDAREAGGGAAPSLQTSTGWFALPPASASVKPLTISSVTCYLPALSHTIPPLGRAWRACMWGRLAYLKISRNLFQNKGPPKRNLGFKIRGQTEKNLHIAQTEPKRAR